MEIEAPTPDGPSNPGSKSRFEAASERRKAYGFVQLAVLRCHRAFTTKDTKAHEARADESAGPGHSISRPSAFATRRRLRSSPPRNSMKSVANKTCVNSVGARVD